MTAYRNIPMECRARKAEADYSPSGLVSVRARLTDQVVEGDIDEILEWGPEDSSLIQRMADNITRLTGMVELVLIETQR